MKNQNPSKSKIVSIIFVNLFACIACRPCIKGSGHTITDIRNVPKFTEVHSAGSYQIILIEGSESKVSLFGDDNVLPHVKTEVRNGILHIETKGIRCIRHTEDIIIHITSPSYSGIKLSGSGKMSTQDTLHCENFYSILSGSGAIHMNVKAQSYSAELSGSGTYHLSGHTQALSVSISGSGNVFASLLQAEAAAVSISGSGNCAVNSSNSLHIRISGSGNVKYSNQPTVTQTISGSGNISHI